MKKLPYTLHTVERPDYPKSVFIFEDRELPYADSQGPFAAEVAQVCGTPSLDPKPYAERIVSCVNACQGIEDPAAAIRAARGALEICSMVHGSTVAAEALRQLGEEGAQ